MYSVTFPAGEDQADASVLSANSDVLSVEQDHSRDTAGASNDPSYGDQWSLPQIGWDNVYGTIDPGGSATVAVLDTGVDATHPDLANVVVSGRNLIAGNTDTSDDNGHGTAVAGIVSPDTNNNEGVASLARHAYYRARPALPRDVQMRLRRLFSRVQQNASFPRWPLETVIGVGSTGIGDTASGFSNTGADVFLAAPGEGILSTSIGGGYAGVNGTSASAAEVAGAAALMKATRVERL